MSGAKRRKFFCRDLHFFGFTSTISRFGKRFRVASTVWSLSCFCSSYSRCPRAQSFVIVWARAPVPWMESASLIQFQTRKQCKTAIQSECIASHGLFCVQNHAQSDTFISVLQTINQSCHTVWGGGHVPQVPQWHDATAHKSTCSAIWLLRSRCRWGSL